MSTYEIAMYVWCGFWFIAGGLTYYIVGLRIWRAL